MVKCSEVLQCSDVLLVLSFLSLCVWLCVLYTFVSFCKLCRVYIRVLLLCMLCRVYSVFISATLTEVFPCFFLSCKANARVYLAKTGHGAHSS